MSDSGESIFKKPTASGKSSSPSKSKSPAQDNKKMSEPNETKQDTNQNEAVPPDLTLVLEQANDRLLRTQAELENFRKRSQREMEDHRRYAALPVMRELLSVLDNMYLAIKAAQKNDSASGLLNGVKMVAVQLEDVLQKNHCKRIDTVGTPFDPNYHEAVAQQPSKKYPANIISQETRVGYQLHDRVIRPSQVFVSTGRKK